MLILELSSVSVIHMSHHLFLTDFPAIVATMRSAIGAIGAAVFVAILSNKAPAKIAEMVPPAAINAGLPEASLTDLFTAIGIGSSAALAGVPGMTPEIETAVVSSLSNAYAAAYAYVYYAAVAFGGVGLIACICIRDFDKHFTGHVPRKIYKAGEKDGGDLSDKEAEQREHDKNEMQQEFKEMA